MKSLKFNFKTNLNAGNNKLYAGSYHYIQMIQKNDYEIFLML